MDFVTTERLSAPGTHRSLNLLRRHRAPKSPSAGSPSSHKISPSMMSSAPQLEPPPLLSLPPLAEDLFVTPIPSLQALLQSELRWDHTPLEIDKGKGAMWRMCNFWTVAAFFEVFAQYGMLVCADSFAHMFTFAPLRVLVALFTLTTAHPSWAALLAVCGWITKRAMQVYAPSVVRHAVFTVVGAGGGAGGGAAAPGQPNGRAVGEWPEALLIMAGIAILAFLSGFLLRHTAVASWPARLQRRFTRVHAFELIRAGMLVSVIYVLRQVETGAVYHFLKHQDTKAAAIKLYLIVGIMEVGERLLISFGTDALDAVQHAVYAAPAPGAIRSRGDAIQLLQCAVSIFVVAPLYLLAHSLFIFVHVIVIFVAVTSKDEVMMILLISAHFYELKSLVFKRFDERQIFQIAAADVVERFVVSFFDVVPLTFLRPNPSHTLTCSFPQHLWFRCFSTSAWSSPKVKRRRASSTCRVFNSFFEFSVVVAVAVVFVSPDHHDRLHTQRETSKILRAASPVLLLRLTAVTPRPVSLRPRSFHPPPPPPSQVLVFRNGSVRSWRGLVQAHVHFQVQQGGPANVHRVRLCSS